MTEQNLTTEAVEGADYAAWKKLELKAMHPAAVQFEARIKALNLKGAKLANAMESFYEGAMNVAVNLSYMSSERAGIVGFMCSIGRLNEMHKLWLNKAL